MTDLQAIFTRYGTPKGTGGRPPWEYVPVFEALFHPLRSLPIRILEIGNGTLDENAHSNMKGSALPGYRPGAGLLSWAEYFPHAHIHGLDIKADATNVISQAPASIRKRITTFHCDSTKGDHTMAVLGTMFDGASNEIYHIIFDDGSHRPADVAATLRNCYRFLKKQGYYIIEDMADDSRSEGVVLTPEQIQEIVGHPRFFYTGFTCKMCVILK